MQIVEVVEMAVVCRIYKKKLQLKYFGDSSHSMKRPHVIFEGIMLLKK
jgi:hypothetical protein